MLYRALLAFFALIAFAGCPAGVPQISVTPASLDFGEVPVNESFSRTVVLENIGDASTVISFAVTPDTPFEVALAGAISVEPGDSRTIFVESSPTAVGAVSGTLTLAWSEGVAEVDLNVVGVQSNADNDEDGYTEDVDCDDENPDVNPGATEVCNGIDDDCEGGVDEDFDIDGDDFTTCGQDGVAGTADDDCDDANADVNPNGVELCDDADNNCDGTVDEGFDADSDGYTTCGGDCDDTDAGISPDGTEVCNGIDENCDGTIDDGFDDLDLDGAATCTDCDDEDDEVAPGLPEVCDDKDNDCNSQVDDGFPDADSDTFNTCDDCDDGNPNAFPGAAQICDSSLDNDCDGVTDPAESDDDGDGATECAGDCNDSDLAVNPNDDDGDGVSTCAAIPDCDDNDASNFPGNTELCDGLDNDCDGQPENSGDVDGDGVSVCAGDCDDNNAAIFPGATETCDGLDNDCDGAVDQGFTDNDGDGAADCVDCDDNDATAFPGNVEICDAVDNDCDTTVDEGFDADNDSFFDDADAGCSAAYGANADCNDGNAAVYPGAPDVCDAALDNDCDGNTDPLESDDDADGESECAGDCDDADPSLNLADADSDGVNTCAVEADCDDADATAYPGATELCDGIDNDCTTVIDNGFDDDSDGFYDGSDPGCVTAYGASNVDCNDGSNAVYPSAPDVCDAFFDNDCDGVDDPDEADDDLDGESECEGDCDDTDSALNVTDADSDGVTTCDLDPDCDDSDGDVFPGAIEYCSDDDLNCDGVAATPCTTCAEVLAASPATRAGDDGDWLIDPDGAGPLPTVTAYCDLTTDGGGWTLIMRTTDDGADNTNLLTTYASMYSTQVGSADGSGAYRMPGENWEILADNGDGNDEFMVSYILVKAGGLGVCDPVNEMISASGNTLSVPSTGSATYVYSGVDTYSVVNGIGGSGTQVALFSATDDGPQAASCVVANDAAPWFYRAGCGDIYPTASGSLYTTPLPAVRERATDLASVSTACNGDTVQQNGVWYEAGLVEFYVR